MTSAGRRFLASAVTGLTGIAMLVAVLAHYASVMSSPGFSGRAVSVVSAGPVRSLIVNNISGRVLAATGGQSGIQPLIPVAVEQALSDAHVRANIRAAAESLQSQLLSGNAHTLTLALPDIGPAIAASIRSRSPQLAAEVARLGTLTVVDVRIPPSAARAVNDLARLGRDASLLVVLTVALGALALLLSIDRRRTVAWLGVAALGSGLLAEAAYLAGRGLITNQFSSTSARTAAGVVWRVYLGGLGTMGLILAAGGALVAATTFLVGARRSTPARTADRSQR
jgi:hypothetical protein